MDADGDITSLIEASRDGETGAAALLYARVYEQLKRIARRQRRRQGAAAGETLSTTALVHETYERLAPPGALSAESRAHFLALSARAMRQILIDHARRRGAGKRGSGTVAVEWNDEQFAGDGDPVVLIELDQRLQRMQHLDPHLVQLVELHGFAGLELVQIAELLGVSLRTVQRDWQRARAWLSADLS